MPILAFIQLASSMLIVGLCVTLGKMAVEYMPVIALAGVRCLAAALALWPLARRERAEARPMTGRDRFDLVAQAFFGVFAFTLLMLGGVERTSASEAGLIAATMPLAILVLALPLLGEGLNARALVAALIASLGIALVTLTGNGVGTGTNRMLGNALVLCAVVAEALYTLFAKRLAGRISPALMALRLNLVALAMFAPLMVFQSWGTLVETVPPSAWALGALYGIGTSAIALLLWYRGTRRVAGATAGLFTVFLPVGAIGSAAWLLGEEVGARQLAGGAVIAFALLVGLVPARGFRASFMFRPRG